MGHYIPADGDMEFVLFDVLGAGQRYASGAFPGFDESAARDVLDAVRVQACEQLTGSYVDADRNPPVYDPETKTVTVAPSFAAEYKAFMSAEWWRLDIPESLEGAAAPPSLRWAAAELILGANPAAFMYMAGPAFATVVDMYGTPSQKKFAQMMVDRQWGATMVLTEPDAGSDVGAGRTKAFDNGDGTWRIEGVKRFITSGEHDMSENIIHLVLARPEGARPGTKGLSLFIVPKYNVDLETGELTGRNGVYATNVEHKMGLKASTTCELTFGQDAPATGWLLGDVHDGIAQMFTVIEYARMMVGTKSMAQASSGYLNALEYARTRVQGSRLSQSADKAAPRVPIIEHPDVRTMLMYQKAWSEGLRALVYYTAAVSDVAASGVEFDGLDGQMAPRLADLLLPLVKAGASERAWTSLTLSLQTLGGSGYLTDYPVEQYLRDAKIDSLYEGTTGIQGMDFFFRKIVKDQFVALSWLKTRMLADAQPLGDSLDPVRERLRGAIQALEDMVTLMLTWAMGSGEDPSLLDLVGQNTTRLVLAATDVVVGWLWLRQAQVVLSGADYSPGLVEGKTTAARWFADQVLALLPAQAASAAAVTGDLMTLPDTAW